jgi:Peptidase family M28
VVRLRTATARVGSVRGNTQLISRELAADGIEAWHDNFTAATPASDIAMTNIIGIVPGEGSSVVVVAGHYDTARLEGIRFVGANDGGSSAALLLEVARVLTGHKNRNQERVGVEQKNERICDTNRVGPRLRVDSKPKAELVEPTQRSSRAHRASFVNRQSKIAKLR